MLARVGTTLIEELQKGWKQAATQWAKRIASALDLRQHAATWRDTDRMGSAFRKLPMTRRVRTWLAKTGTKLEANDQLAIAIVVTAVSQFRGVWMSNDDWGLRLGCSGRTMRNIRARLEALDIFRVVAQYDDVAPYIGRANGKVYKRSQRPNVITLGEVGRTLFGRAALTKTQRATHDARLDASNGTDSGVVDNVFVASPFQTRKRFPPNERITTLTLKKEAVSCVDKPIPAPEIGPERQQALAEARTRRLLGLIPTMATP